MVVSSDVVLKGIVPVLGCTVSCLMYMSPLGAVQHANGTKALGDLNPLPFSITICSSTVWFVYGLLKRDMFVCCPNIIGILLAFYSVLSTYALANERLQKKMRVLLCSECSILLSLGLTSSFWATNLHEQMVLWGLAGNLTTICYFGAPLSTMTEVIRTRNSASILRPLTTMNTASACLWSAYGLALADAYIYIPNTIGLGLSGTLMSLACIFPSKQRHVSPQQHAGTHVHGGLHFTP
mmetsp:Transcript_27373/g.74022  ORF Transcript_27373/g.74022 Transcript_27373/m.74022 type:complete len:238 (-) Transcript_27373:778-1491(-)